MRMTVASKKMVAHLTHRRRRRLRRLPSLRRRRRPLVAIFNCCPPTQPRRSFVRACAGPSRKSRRRRSPTRRCWTCTATWTRLSFPSPKSWDGMHGCVCVCVRACVRACISVASSARFCWYQQSRRHARVVPRTQLSFHRIDAHCWSVESPAFLPCNKLASRGHSATFTRRRR